VKRTLTILGPVLTLVGAVVVGGTGGGCGDDSKPGVSASGGKLGSGGSVQGQGGSTVVGTIASGGVLGSGGASATGGTTAMGSGGATGRKDAGNGTGGLGAGGSTIVADGGVTKGGAGGATGTMPGFGGTIATGGMLKGGTGGGVRGTGGAAGAGGAIDGGMPDAPLPKCSDVTTQAECDARDDCYSVFEDKNDCGCPTPGCCASFKSCSNGSYANCLDNAMCDMITPVCNPPYVLAYKNLCYEGCVFQDDCGLLPCPKSAPQNGSACSPANGSCYYEDCAGGGRMLASCVDRVWKVETAACNAYPCQAPEKDGGVLTCAAGEICVVNTDTSFRVTPSCEKQTCGTRPMSTDCIEGTDGWCSTRYKLDGVVISCSMPVPSGG